MKEVYFLCIIICISLTEFFVIPSFGTGLTGNSEELIIRGGIPNFIHSASVGDSICIAYLGGSITRQDGWRDYSFNWIQNRFPNTRFHQINAAIGGTGSDFGAYRLSDHVMIYQPDLVFIEFAVNDNGKTEEKIIQSMEGIVRQIWISNPSVDICFVYTTMASFLETEQNSMLPPSKVAMEKVADYYQIPSINFGTEIARRVAEGSMIYTGEKPEIDDRPVFSIDGVHPFKETGHISYFEVFQRSFEKLIGFQSNHTCSREMPVSMLTNPFERTKIVDVDDDLLQGDWQRIYPDQSTDFAGFSQYFDVLYVAGSENEEIRFKFKGTGVGAFDIMGPGTGRLSVEIDGLIIDTVFRFDAYCTYYRMSYFTIENLDDEEHEVVFKPIMEPFDKEEILKKRNETIRKPEDYDAFNWYVGKLLVNGTLMTN